MVRAKFRVMSVNRQWNGQVTEVRLLPVYGKTGQEYDPPDACEENRSFWDATPAGEAYVRYGTIDEAEVPFTLGRTYYIDMTPSEETTRWKLQVTSQYEGQLDVKLECKWDSKVLRSGDIEMSVTNEASWPAFKGPGPGSYWTVSFTESEG